MTPKKLRANLIALRDRMTDSQTAQRESLSSESGRFRAPQNMAEQASDEQELDMMAARLTNSSETVAKIDDAIRNLDAGKYNVCEECGKEIGERRLTIQPWSTMCVACQKKLEEENS